MERVQEWAVVVLGGELDSQLGKQRDREWVQGQYGMDHGEEQTLRLLLSAPWGLAVWVRRDLAGRR